MIGFIAISALGRRRRVVLEMVCGRGARYGMLKECWMTGIRLYDGIYIYVIFEMKSVLWSLVYQQDSIFVVVL